MQFITSLFGGSGNSLLIAVFALCAVIVAIILLLWIFKLIFQTSGTLTRNRNRRLSVIASLPLDPKRQLLLIRRDNVEHLVLVGGPQDILVETGISVPEAPAVPTRRSIPTASDHKPGQPIAIPPVKASTSAHESGQTTILNRHRSLRHTGLMRPDDEGEAPLSPENVATPPQVGSDSAKQAKIQRDEKGINFVDNSNEANQT